jgi:hypothetical protein
MKPVRALTAALLIAAACGATIAPAAARPAGTPTVVPTQRLVLGTSSPPRTSLAGADTASSAATDAPIETGRVLVRVKGSATPSALSSIATKTRATTRGLHSMRHGMFAWAAPKGVSADAFAKRLVATGKVEYAVPDYARHFVDYTPPALPGAIANDPFFLDTRVWGSSTETFPFGYSWWLRDVNAPQAWLEGYTGPNIIGKYPLRAGGTTFQVAVIDSGLYTSHPDVGVNVVGGHDFFDHQLADGTIVEDNDVTPVDWHYISSQYGNAEKQKIAAHGTCVAGEIGATENNLIGTVGVGYDTQVVVHKVMGYYNSGIADIDDGAVVEAILYATDNGAKVINMSFGGYVYSKAYVDAINYATSHGVVVVAAKGNDGSGAAFYPADNAGVVSVGALDKNVDAVSVPADFSNYHKTSMDIMAPGSFVIGLSQPGTRLDSEVGTDYAMWDGTSMASPIVAGAIAWLWRAAPALSASEITNLVLGTASKHGAYTHWPNGWRELDMYAAYKALEARYPLLVKPAVVGETVAPLGATTRVWWSEPLANQRGVTFDTQVDGGATSTTSATRGDYALALGSHTLTVQAHSNYNWDDGTAIATATIDVVAPADGLSSLTANVAGTSQTSAVTGYAQGIALDGTLTDASGAALCGATVTLQSSTDGTHFSAVSGAAIDNVANGVYRAVVAPTTRTYYRFAFAGVPSTVGASTSGAVVITPRVALSTPSSKSSVLHTRSLAVSGTLKPAHLRAPRLVQLRFFRWSGDAWVLYARAWTRITYHTGYSTYSASVRLKKGGYRIYAYSPGDAGHAATTSGYHSVAVK